METIISEIFKDISFTQVEAKLMSEQLEEIKLAKGDFLLKAGEDIDAIHYIHEGCLRTYFEDSGGKEHTLQFAIKGWWTSDYIALYGSTENKAVSNIECIKDTTLYKISKREFDILCEKIPTVNSRYIENLESAFAAFHRRILDNLTLTAKERYVNFLTAYPNIEQNVKNYHIASYLGITTESLSRIRKELSST